MRVGKEVSLQCPLGGCLDQIGVADICVEGRMWCYAGVNCKLC